MSAHTEIEIPKTLEERVAELEQRIAELEATRPTVEAVSTMVIDSWKSISANLDRAVQWP